MALSQHLLSLKSRLKGMGRKASVTFSLLIINSGMCLLAAIVVALIVKEPDLHLIAQSFVFFCLLVYVACLAIFLTTQSYALTANALALGLYCIISTAVFFSGGHTSPIYQLYLCIPVFTFLLAGFRIGLFWAFVISFTLIIVYLIPTLGITYQQLLTRRIADIFNLVMPLFLNLLIVGALCIYQKTSQAKHREMVRAKEEAELATRAKSIFLANMSHEIRTPMNGVLGIVQLLQDTELNTQQKYYLETVKNSGESLVHIINEILDYSKIEAGRVNLESIPFDLIKLIDEVMMVFSIQAIERKVHLITQYQGKGLRWVVGDPTR
jgi:signal transduction histidine kinase